MKRFRFILLFIPFLMYIQAVSQPGALDITFGTNGIVTNDFGSDCEKAYSVAIQQDGKIVVAGEFRIEADDAILVARYNTNGTLDQSFSVDGIVTTLIGSGDCPAYSIAIQQDGKIVVAGYSYNESSGEFAVVRYNSNGTLDHIFGVNGIATTDIGIERDAGTSMIIQPDGKIVVAGYSDNGTDDDFAVVRYNPDGSLDNTFSDDGIVTTAIGSDSDMASCLTIQQDGKIVVGGKTHNGTDYDFAVVRYNTNGTLDNTFGEGGKVTTAIGDDFESAQAVAVQEDGKIILTGYYVAEGGHSIAVVRYNSDGTLDNTFNGGGIVTYFNGNSCRAHSLALQSDGKIIVAGEAFSEINNIEFVVLRYNTDGTLDNSFDTDGIVTTSIGGNYDIAFAVAIQQDGKIVATGYYEPEEEIQDIALVRYLSGLNLGTVDFSIQENILSVYPNPLKNNAILKYELVKEETISIDLYDMQGKLIQNIISEERRTVGTHEESLSFDSSVPSGLYSLVISNDTGNYGVQISKY